ncbi:MULTISPECIES: hypothetical protein [unclassified Mucilaginibacter]|nr:MULTISPECIES: hypothetical protein [unclassified Mucilaginibacter]
MPIKPQHIAESGSDDFAHLTPLQQRTRKAAIVLAFIGVFVWAVKILFL